MSRTETEGSGRREGGDGAASSGLPCDERSGADEQMEERDDEKMVLAEWARRKWQDKHLYIPPSRIAKYPDLLEKAWGWERLLPFMPIHGAPHQWPIYVNYLEEFYKRNATEDFLHGPTAALYCLKMDSQLVSEWKSRVIECAKFPSNTLFMSRLIRESAKLIIQEYYARGEVPAASPAALMCIANEYDLVCELLKRGVKADEHLIRHSSSIRMCALSLINCKGPQSVAAAAAMLGITKEAKRMSDWIKKNDKPIPDFPPALLINCPDFRAIHLALMIRILEGSRSHLLFDKVESSNGTAYGGNWNDTAVAATANSTWGDAIGKLNHQEKKKISVEVKRRKKITQRQMIKVHPAMPAALRAVFRNKNKAMAKKTKRNFQDQVILGKAWGWERLLPFMGSADFHSYIKYLKKYYNRNTIKNCGIDNGNDLAAAAESCLKMEDKLASEWDIQVTDCMHSDYTPVIASRIIQERVHLIIQRCAAEDEIHAVSFAALVCITKEAELICELLKHGAPIGEYLLQQSHRIRMGALSTINYKGSQSVAAAAAMLGITKEAKMMCDWMRKEDKLIVPSDPFVPVDIDICPRYRGITLGVMMKIMEEAVFGITGNDQGEEEEVPREIGRQHGAPPTKYRRT